jgi:hypothetical protein
MVRTRHLVTAAATGTALSAGLLAAPAAAAVSSSFTVCAWPLNCTAAAVSGSVNWTTNRLTATVSNTAYSSVTATFRTGSATSLLVAPVGKRTVSSTIQPGDASLTVTLCVPPTLSPNPCVSATVVRPNA